MKPKEFAVMFVGMIAVCCIGFLLGASSMARPASALFDEIKKLDLQYVKTFDEYNKTIDVYEKLIQECEKPNRDQ